MKIVEIRERDIPDIIRGMRLDANLTQDELARKCDVSKCAIVNYENGYQCPSIHILRKIMASFGVHEVRIEV